MAAPLVIAAAASAPPRGCPARCSRLLVAARRRARALDRRVRRHLRDAAAQSATGRRRSRARRSRRRTCSSTSTPAPTTGSTRRSSPASALSRPTTAARPRLACAPASTPTAAAPARCISRSSTTRAPGTATESTATDDGRTSPYEPADAIPAAARYLRASGAPGDYRAALFAYNHADWYVAEVLAKAAAYRGAAIPPRCRS